MHSIDEIKRPYAQLDELLSPTGGLPGSAPVPGERASRVMKGLDRDSLREALALIDSQRVEFDAMFPGESYALLRQIAETDSFWGEGPIPASFVEDMLGLRDKFARVLAPELPEPTLADVVYGPKKVESTGLNKNRAQRRAERSKRKGRR